MPPVSRLGRQVAELGETFRRLDVRFALIGGLALASYKVVRATQDVDLLVDIESAETIDTAFTELGYRVLHRSVDAANYLRDDERVDLLYANRPIARRLLESSVELQTSLGTLRVISAEGLIGFKLQGIVNDPRRTRDLEDIRALLRSNHRTVNIAEVREYFTLSDRDPYESLDDLMAVVEALCPVWPQRPGFQRMNTMLL